MHVAQLSAPDRDQYGWSTPFSLAFAAQLTQYGCPLASLNVPAAQSVHWVSPASEYLPLAQAEQSTVEAAVLYFAAVHGEHAVAPEAVPRVDDPGVHSRHPPVCATGAYFDAGHDTHSPVELLFVMLRATNSPAWHALQKV